MLAEENSCEPWHLNPGEGLSTAASNGEDLPINIDELNTRKFSFLSLAQGLVDIQFL